MSYQHIKKSLNILLGMGLVMLSTLNTANATFDNCTTSQLPFSNIMIANVASELPIGSVIPGSEISASVNISCNTLWSQTEGTSCSGSPNWGVHDNDGKKAVNTNIANVYSLPGMPAGVGYQFLDGMYNPLPIDATGRHNTGVFIRTGLQTVPIIFRMVKVAKTVGEGNTTFVMGMSCNGNEWANKTKANSSLNISIDLKNTTQTCIAINSNIQVKLPTVSVYDFNDVGSTAGKSEFSLNFQCDSNVAAQMIISDATLLTNSTDTLSLQPTSEATGVGIRLTHDGAPVMLAPNQLFDTGGTLFPLNNPTSESVNMSIPLGAEYIKTASSITSGKLEAMALMTISYQ